MTAQAIAFLKRRNAFEDVACRYSLGLDFGAQRTYLGPDAFDGFSHLGSELADGFSRFGAEPFDGFSRFGAEPFDGFSHLGAEPFDLHGLRINAGIERLNARIQGVSQAVDAGAHRLCDQLREPDKHDNKRNNHRRYRRCRRPAHIAKISGARLAFSRTVALGSRQPAAGNTVRAASQVRRDQIGSPGVSAIVLSGGGWLCSDV